MKITKKLALLVLAAAISGTANAQEVRFGIKAGVNIASFSGSDASGFSSQVGFNGGILVNFPIAGMLTLQPEVVYSGQGAKATQGTVTGNAQINYINIPFLFKYTSSVGLYGLTGPQLGLLTSAKVKSGGVSVDDKGDYKSTDIGWAFGIGYLSSANIGIDARYNLGLTNIEATNPNNTGTVKNNVFQIGLFYMFGDSGKK